MTTALTHVVPDDAWHAPSPAQLKAALAFVSDNLHADTNAKLGEALPGAYLSPETRFAAVCPACHAELDFYQFTDSLGDAYDAADASTRSLPYKAPCCGVVVQATDFDFPIIWASERPDEPDWQNYKVAAFARADLCLWEFPRLLSAKERDQIGALLGCPIKLVWYGI